MFCIKFYKDIAPGIMMYYQEHNWADCGETKAASLCN